MEKKYCFYIQNKEGFYSFFNINPFFLNLLRLVDISVGSSASEWYTYKKTGGYRFCVECGLFFNGDPSNSIGKLNIGDYGLRKEMVKATESKQRVPWMTIHTEGSKEHIHVIQSTSGLESRL